MDRLHRALVVDDAAFMRAVLRDILVSNGISTVYEAKDGAAAVEAFRKYRPDVVTMDIIMPEMDGLQALRAILEIDREARVIMVTSVGQEHVIKQAMTLGAKNYLTKPFEKAAVAKVVMNTLDTGDGR